MIDRMGKRVGLGVALVGAAVLGAAVAGATGAVKLRTALVPTAKAPKARGATKLQLKHGARGRFVVTARRLAPNATFDVVVGGVKVGTLTTNHAGGGKLKLSTSPHGREALLGFDPRGSQIAVRDEGGDDDLVGDEPAGDSASGACCLRDHEGETECEDVAPADCTKAGGTPSPATSCLPDPCTGTPPPVQKIVCCIANSAHGAFVDEDPEVECEHVDNQADCASAGGTVVQGTSCEGDPCAPTPPATRVACCLSGEGESECAMLTAESCAAHHGTAATAPSCESHPCGGGDEPPTGQHGDHHGGDDQG